MQTMLGSVGNGGYRSYPRQEGFVMGVKAGMDPSAVLEVLKVSSAASVLGRGSLFLSRKFD